MNLPGERLFAWHMRHYLKMFAHIRHTHFETVPYLWRPFMPIPNEFRLRDRLTARVQ